MRSFAKAILSILGLVLVSLSAASPGISTAKAILAVPMNETDTIIHAQRWVYRYDGVGSGLDQAVTMVQGPDGTIYIGGQSKGDGTSADMIVIALSSAGEEVWVYRYNGPASKKDYCAQVACGPDGNIYAVGSSRDENGLYTILVVSLDAQGEERWVYLFDKQERYNDLLGASLAFGPDGNIYIGAWGNSTEGDKGRETMVVSLTTAGEERWVYETNTASQESLWEIACGDDGNVYMSMTYADATSNSSDLQVMSVDSSGIERWSYVYDGTGEDADSGYGITVGSDGNVYVTGYSMGAGWDDEDVIVISLNSLGEERWVHRYDGPSSGGDAGYAVVYGPDDNLYVCGEAKVGSTTYDSDFLVLSLDTEGQQRWVYRYNGPKNSQDDGYRLVCGQDGNIYAAGYSTGNETGKDYVVVSLDPEQGKERWVYRYNGPANREDELWPIIFGEDGNIYAAGVSDGGETSEDIAVVSLDRNNVLPQSESPAMTALPTGNKVVSIGEEIWCAYEAFGRIYALRSKDGGSTWTERLLVSDKMRDCYYPAMASDGSAPHIVWKNEDGIFWSHFDGSVFAEPTRVLGDNWGLPAIYGPPSFSIFEGEGYLVAKRIRAIIPARADENGAFPGTLVLARWSLMEFTGPEIEILARGVRSAVPGLSVGGGIHLVYCNRGEVLYQNGNDEPVNVSDSPDAVSRNPFVLAEESYPGSGEFILHVVWEEFQAVGEGAFSDVFYAYKDPGAQVWSEPWQITTSIYTSESHPQYIAGGDSDVIVWDEVFLTGAWETAYAVEDAGSWVISSPLADARYPQGLVWESSDGSPRLTILMTEGNRSPYSLCLLFGSLD